MPITITCTIDAAIAEARNDCRNTIKRARQDCRNNVKEIRAGAKQIGKLAVALPPEVQCEIRSSYGYTNPVVELDREHLATVRKSVGHLKVMGKSLADAETRQIRVSLKADKFPAVRFSYLRTLPPASTDPVTGMICEIIEVTSPAHTYKTLVCRPAPVASKEPVAVQEAATQEAGAA